jgi:hypothetical protein
MTPASIVLTPDRPKMLNRGVSGCYGNGNQDRSMIDVTVLDQTMRRFPFLIEAARSARHSETWVGDIAAVIDRRLPVIVAEYHITRRQVIQKRLRDAIARTDHWVRAA